MNKENNYIKIFDTTLRDGEQSPGASMNIEEKLLFKIFNWGYFHGFFVRYIKLNLLFTISK